MRLTRLQRATLLDMTASGSYYAPQDDRTLCSLKRKGLVYWRSRLGSYGRSYWALTVDGVGVAFTLENKKLRHGANIR